MASVTIGTSMATNSSRKVLIWAGAANSGGFYRYVRGLLGNGGIPQQFEVHLVCSTFMRDQLGQLDASITVHAHPWSSSSSKIKRYLWRRWIVPRLTFKIRPDVEFLLAGPVPRACRKAVRVVACLNLLPFDPREIDRYAGTAMHDWIMGLRARTVRTLRQADGIIFVSRLSQDKICEQVPEIKRSKVVLYGIEKPFFLEENRSYRLGDTVTLIYVSAVVLYKNQAEVVTAVSRLRQQTGVNVRLRIIGGMTEPVAANQLRERIRAEGAEAFVDLVGEIEQKQIMGEYRRADIYVFASSCEVAPMTVLEAMGARLPRQSADRLLLWIEPGTGFHQPRATELSKSVLAHVLLRNLGRLLCVFLRLGAAQGRARVRRRF